MTREGLAWFKVPTILVFITTQYEHVCFPLFDSEISSIGDYSLGQLLVGFSSPPPSWCTLCQDFLNKFVAVPKKIIIIRGSTCLSKMSSICAWIMKMRLESWLWCDNLPVQHTINSITGTPNYRQKYQLHGRFLKLHETTKYHINTRNWVIYFIVRNINVHKLSIDVIFWSRSALIN